VAGDVEAVVQGPAGPKRRPLVGPLMGGGRGLVAAPQAACRARSRPVRQVSIRCTMRAKWQASSATSIPRCDKDFKGTLPSAW